MNCPVCGGAVVTWRDYEDPELIFHAGCQKATCELGHFSGLGATAGEALESYTVVMEKTGYLKGDPTKAGDVQ